MLGRHPAQGMVGAAPGMMAAAADPGTGERVVQNKETTRPLDRAEVEGSPQQHAPVRSPLLQPAVCSGGPSGLPPPVERPLCARLRRGRRLASAASGARSPPRS